MYNIQYNGYIVSKMLFSTKEIVFNSMNNTNTGIVMDEDSPLQVTFDFLNEIYVEEGDYDNLYYNIINNCKIDLLEEYREYIGEKYNDDILEIYKNLVLKESKTSKNISGYTLILNYLDIMISYENSFEIVKNLISVLRNKYSQRKLFMEKLEEFEVLNSLK